MTRNLEEKEREVISSDSLTEKLFITENEYSIYRSIAKGWHMFADAPRSYFLKNFLGILLAGIGLCSATGSVCYLLAHHIMPARFYTYAGVPESEAWRQCAPSAGEWALYITIFAIGIVLYRLSKWGTWILVMRRMSTEKDAESNHPEKLSCIVKKVAKRMLVYNSILWLPVLIFFIGSVLLAYSLLPTWKPLPYVCISVIILLFIGISVFSAPGRTAYVLEREELKNAFKISLNHGTKRFGGLFIISILTFIPFILTACAILLPLAAFPLAVSANAVNNIIGQPSGIPSSVTIVYATASVFAFSFLAFMGTLRTLPIILKTISIKKVSRNA